jgi:glycosyltransferase involved in cell wall biosynthesis
MSIYHKEKPEFFKLAFDSILNQTLLPNEIVLVKDGPLTDELDNILLKYISINQNLIKVVSLEKNVGLSKALNIGLKKCKYDYVARMDTDDIALPNRFEIQIYFLNNNPSIDVVGSWAYLFDDQNDNNGVLKTPELDDKIKKSIWTCPFVHPTVIFKKESILKVGSYNADAGPRQDDYDLWFRCAYNNLNFANIPQPLLKYRFTDNNIIKNTVKVGWYRMKVGYKWCWKLKCSPIAYIGIPIPFFRALLPYPLNVRFYHFMKKFRPN